MVDTRHYPSHTPPPTHTVSRLNTAKVSFPLLAHNLNVNSTREEFLTRV